MPGAGTQARGNTCSLVDVAILLLVGGVTLAIAAVDGSLWYAGLAVAGGAALVLLCAGSRRNGVRSTDLHACYGATWRFALLSYGMVAEEWEHMRGAAAPAPDRSDGNARKLEAPAGEAGGGRGSP